MEYDPTTHELQIRTDKQAEDDQPGPTGPHVSVRSEDVVLLLLALTFDLTYTTVLHSVYMLKYLEMIQTGFHQYDCRLLEHDTWA